MSGPLFSGASVHSLDEKFRLNVPKRLVDQIGESESELVLTASPDGCLWLVDRLRFVQLSSRFEGDLLDQAPDRRRLRRVVLGHAESCSLDKSGRVLIPEVLRSFIKLGTSREVVVVGAGDVIELWSQGSWNEDIRKAQGDSSVKNNTVGTAAG